jgi:RNA polymerase sigma-70 factor, ECF subfamily
MDYTGFNDETLVELMVQAKPEALAELYDRYGRLVYRLALAMLNETRSAEDVTQEAFLRAWQHAASYRSEQGKVSTWLTAIARNRAIDILRRRRSRNENGLVSIEEMPSFALPDAQNVEREVDRLNRQQLVRNAIAQLPVEQRITLALAYFGGLTQEQISERLGVPVGTVKTRARLALQKLRRSLSEAVEEEQL